MFSIKIDSGLMLLDHPQVMAIVNVTTDSFYARSRCMTEEALISRLDECVQGGADWLDIGACSTRPQSQPISEQEELENLHRALCIVEQYEAERGIHLPISIDTFRPQVVAKIRKQHRISMVNDISGGTEEMYDVVAHESLAYTLTHNGDFRRIADMVDYLQQRVDSLNKKGVADIVIDPGFGFGKDVGQNYFLLRNIDWIKQMLQLPLLVGISRKRMVYELLKKTPETALSGTLAAGMLALQGGADILRVHDVQETTDIIKVWREYQSSQSCQTTILETHLHDVSTYH